MQEATFTHDELIIVAMLVRQHLEQSQKPAPFLEELDRKLSALANDNDTAAPNFTISVTEKKRGKR